MSPDRTDRRHLTDRRTGQDRRGRPDRRAHPTPAPDAPFQFHGERRSGAERRRGGDRRSGLDRRAPESPRDQIGRALDLVAYVAESTDLSEDERRALDSAIMRLRFALAHLGRGG